MKKKIVSLNPIAAASPVTSKKLKLLRWLCSSQLREWPSLFLMENTLSWLDSAREILLRFTWRKPWTILNNSSQSKLLRTNSFRRTPLVHVKLSLLKLAPCKLSNSTEILSSCSTTATMVRYISLPLGERSMVLYSSSLSMFKVVFYYLTFANKSEVPLVLVKTAVAISSVNFLMLWITCTQDTWPIEILSSKTSWSTLPTWLWRSLISVMLPNRSPDPQKSSAPIEVLLLIWHQKLKKVAATVDKRPIYSLLESSSSSLLEVFSHSKRPVAKSTFITCSVLANFRSTGLKSKALIFLQSSATSCNACLTMTLLSALQSKRFAAILGSPRKECLQILAFRVI